MQLRYRQQVTAAGVSVVALALTLGACSSSSSSSPPSSGSSSSSSSGGSANLSGTLNASRSTFQLTFQQEAIAAFKSVQSDSSGTTANFTEFLVDAVGSAWSLGSSSTIKWPSSARAASGNPGVAQVVKSTPGAIGYVDYATAKASGLSFASVKNKDGSFVAPSPASATAAAASVTAKPDLTFAAVWQGGASAYPITYQSWDLVNAKQPTANDAAMLKAYLTYLLGDGQKLLPQIGLAPLPSSLDRKAVAQLDKITS